MNVHKLQALNRSLSAADLKGSNSLPEKQLSKPILEPVVDSSSSPNVINFPSGNVQHSQDKALNEFKDLAETLQLLDQLSGFLSWDQIAYLPENASDIRAWQTKRLTKLSIEMLTSAKMERLLNHLEAEEVFPTLGIVDKALVKQIRKQYEREKKVPIELSQELVETTTKAVDIWEKAKEEGDFNKFAPILEKIVLLKRQEAKYLGYKDSPYDALLNEYEEGLTTKELDKLFSALKRELIPIIKLIKEKGVQPDASFLHKSYGHDKQIDLSKKLLEHIGFDLSSGRLDESEHPTCTNIGENDVRITTKVLNKNLWFGISNAIHEGGHGLYAHGLDSALSKSPLHDSPSMGIDESQSRLYETIVGQSLPFWIYYFPKLQEQFPKQLDGVTLEDFYKAINRVQPSLIRIEADEITYQMHVIVRYEIEKDLIEGKLEVKDISKAWKKKMEKYLGVTPTNDTEGPLQDVHWADGCFGYFPTYTLGNLYAAQIYNTAKNAIPDLEMMIASGNMKVLKEWLRENIHKYGSTEDTKDIIKRVTGEDLNPRYFIEYIKSKYRRIYPDAFKSS